MLSTLDIDTAEGEARAVHAYSQGWFAVLSKFADASSKQRMFKMDMLDDVVRALDRAPDTYLSQASFAAKSRRVSALSTLGCAFVDLDCYKLGFVPDEHLVNDLMAEAADTGMPVPSYVTYSGRGLYLKWLFDAPVPAVHLHRWRALQSVLVPMFRAFGADVVAKDAARYLRVVGSVNTAGQGRRVAQLWRSDKRYSFDDLCQAAASVDMSQWQPASRTLGGLGAKNAAAAILLPNHAAGPEGRGQEDQAVRRLIAGRQKRLLLSEHELSEAQTRQAHAAGLANLDAYARSREPIMLEAFSRRSLAWRRFIDLRDLAMSRQGIPQGSRDIHLFWMLNFLAQAGVVNEANFEDEARVLSSSFVGSDFKPMKDGSLSTIRSRVFNYTQGTRERALRASAKGKPARDDLGDLGGLDTAAAERGNAAKQRPLYNPSTDFLIDLFEISPEEQCKLATLIGAEEKLRRSDLKAPGRAERREARLTWRALATQLAEVDRQAGCAPSVSRIAQMVGVHKSMVSRLLAGKIGAQPGQRSYVRHAARVAPLHADRATTGPRNRDANPFARLAAAAASARDSRSQRSGPGADRSALTTNPVTISAPQGMDLGMTHRVRGNRVNPFARLAAKAREDQGKLGNVGRDTVRPADKPSANRFTSPAVSAASSGPDSRFGSAGLPFRQKPHAAFAALAAYTSGASSGSSVVQGASRPPFPEKSSAAQTVFAHLPVAEFSVDRKENQEELHWASKGNAFGLHSALNGGGPQKSGLAPNGSVRAAPHGMDGPGNGRLDERLGLQLDAPGPQEVCRHVAAGLAGVTEGASGGSPGGDPSNPSDPSTMRALEEAAEQVRMLTIAEDRRRAAEREAEQQRLIAEREQQTLRALQRIERLRQGGALQTPKPISATPATAASGLSASQCTAQQPGSEGSPAADEADALLQRLRQLRPNGRT